MADERTQAENTPLDKLTDDQKAALNKPADRAVATPKSLRQPPRASAAPQGAKGEPSKDSEKQQGPSGPEDTFQPDITALTADRGFEVTAQAQAPDPPEDTFQPDITALGAGAEAMQEEHRKVAAGEQDPSDLYPAQFDVEQDNDTLPAQSKPQKK